MTKKEAVKLGTELRECMKGRGWKVRVWENCGWNYQVTNGPITVNPSPGTEDRVSSVWVMMTDDLQYPGAGPPLWTDTRDYRDPNRAVAAQAKRARRELNKLTKIVTHVEALTQGEI